MGNIISDDDPSGDIGVLDFDGDYDTTYCKYLEDCNDKEMEVLKRESYFWLKNKI